MADINTFVSKYMIPAIPTEGYNIAWTGFFQSPITTDISGTFLVRPVGNPALTLAIRRVVLYGADDVLGRGPLHAFSVIEAKIAQAVKSITWALRSKIVSWRILDLTQEATVGECKSIPYSIARYESWARSPVGVWASVTVDAVDQILRAGVPEIE